MTDEEVNRNTLRWPSAPNIVRLRPPETMGCIPHVLTTLLNQQLRAIDNLVRGASPGDVFVFYCMLRTRRHPALPLDRYP